MFGVIIWSDPIKGSAVIWCEDQGDLAYFDPQYKKAVGAMPISPKRYQTGDLVQFETVVHLKQTYAINVQDVDPGNSDVVMPGVPRKSRAVSEAFATGAPLSSLDAAGEVIDLAEHKSERRSSPFGAGLSLRG